MRLLLLAVLAAGALAVRWWRACPLGDDRCPLSRWHVPGPEPSTRWDEPEDGVDPMDPYLASLVNDFTYYPTR